MKKLSLPMFKRAVIATVLISALSGIFSSSFLPVRIAQADCEANYKPAAPGSPICLPETGVTGGFASKTTVGQLIFSVIQVLLILSAVVAILFIIIGGFRYMTSSGNQEQADKGKKMITSAIIGLVIVILSYTIVSILIRTVTTGDVLGTGGGGPTGTTTCPPGTYQTPTGCVRN